jgi:hypothetical protein
LFLSHSQKGDLELDGEYIPRVCPAGTHGRRRFKTDCTLCEVGYWCPGKELTNFDTWYSSCRADILSLSLSPSYLKSKVKIFLTMQTHPSGQETLDTNAQNTQQLWKEALLICQTACACLDGEQHFPSLNHSGHTLPLSLTLNSESCQQHFKDVHMYRDKFQHKLSVVRVCVSGTAMLRTTRIKAVTFASRTSTVREESTSCPAPSSTQALPGPPGAIAKQDSTAIRRYSQRIMSARCASLEATARETKSQLKNRL